MFLWEWSHNPYFNRWFSAIKEEFLQRLVQTRHNPYFNRWFSAIMVTLHKDKIVRVTILILIDGFLQFKLSDLKIKSNGMSQSLF